MVCTAIDEAKQSTFARCEKNLETQLQDDWERSKQQLMTSLGLAFNKWEVPDANDTTTMGQSISGTPSIPRHRSDPGITSPAFMSPMAIAKTPVSDAMILFGFGFVAGDEENTHSECHLLLHTNSPQFVVPHTLRLP